MSKKILSFAFLTAFGTLSFSQASWKEGYYASVSGGYSKVTGKLKASPTAQISGQNRGSIVGQSTSTGSYVGSIALGHRATFGRRHFSGELGVSYSNVRSRVGRLTANANHTDLGLVNGSSYDIRYQPRLGVFGTVRGGYLFTPEVLGFLSLGVEHNIGRHLLEGSRRSSISANVTSVVPGFGFEGKINEKLFWLASAAYKWAINASKKASGVAFTRRPRELVGKVGLGYHF